jgi:fatty acid desaturase
MRFFEHQEYRWYFRFQPLYLWVVFLLYTPSQFVHHTWCVLVAYRHSLTLTDKLLHVLVKGVFFVLPIALCLWLHPLPMALGLLFLFVMSTSYCSIFLLFIQHEDSYLPESELEPWSVRQARTASSWRSPSRLLQWMLGYFNYHIEHHLFPALDPALYPRIQPIVKEVCARHGVEYKHLSYPELVRSQMAAWRKFARPPRRAA